MTLAEGWARIESRLPDAPHDWLMALKGAYYAGASTAGAIVSDEIERGMLAVISALLELQRACDVEKQAQAEDMANRETETPAPPPVKKEWVN